MAQELLSYCRICAAACGIAVTVDGEQVVRVRGDAGHPVSRGYTCSKGRGLAEWHHSSRRLDRPRLRGAEVGWTELLDDLAASLGEVVTADGPDAVGLYLATGMAYDAGGQVSSAMWLGSLGSRSFYTAATVDNAPVLVAADLVAGNPMLSPVWDTHAAGLLLLVGTNPVVSHGYGTALPDPVRHLREHRAGGGRLWVVDPRRTESAALADGHLAVRPGSDVEVLAALASALLRDGADTAELARYCDAEEVDSLRRALAPFTIERAARAAEIDARTIDLLLDEIRAHPGRLAILCGTGTTMSADGILVEWLRWVMLILTGSLDRPGGMRFQHGPLGRLRPPRPSGGDPPPGPRSRPDLPSVVGQQPAVALVDEIEAGNLRALVVTGGNPIGALPEPDRVRAALAHLDVLAVVDVSESELVGLATHVLPATGQLERTDITLAANLSVRSGAQATAPVVAPCGERRPVWWMLANLARRMGADLLGGADPDDLTDELYLRGLLARSHLDADQLFTAGARGVDVAPEHGWVHETMLPNGRWRIVPDVLLARLAERRETVDRPLVLAPRREMPWSNSVRYGVAVDARGPVVRAHPDDVPGLADGDSIEVRSDHGSLVGTLAVDRKVRRGVVSITHNAEEPGPGWLTSAHADVDPLTGMPQASGVPVSVARR